MDTKDVAREIDVAEREIIAVLKRLENTCSVSVERIDIHRSRGPCINRLEVVEIEAHIKRETT